MRVNSIYNYIKENKLKEELNIPGLTHIATGDGWEIYQATTWEGAQSLFVADSTTEKAGSFWCTPQSGTRSAEEVFNSHIGSGDLNLYFFVKQNTNKAYLGALNMGPGQSISFGGRGISFDANYSIEDDNGNYGISDTSNFPLYLLPGFEYINGHDGLIIHHNNIVANYKGLLNPNNIPNSVLIENIDTIKYNAFTNYPVPEVILSDSVRYIESEAFKNYTGTIKCYAESYDDVEWSPDWNGNNHNIEWGFNLSPEERAARLQAAKDSAINELNDYVDPDNYREAEQAQRNEILRDAQSRINAVQSDNEISSIVDQAKRQLFNLKTAETYEREQPEEAERQFQNSETISVLRYKEEGNEITILGCKRRREKLDIPAEINGKPVTKIGAFAFFENLELLEVKVPQTVKVIEKAAFYGCVNAKIYYPKKAILYTDALTNVRSKYPQGE